MGHHRWFVSHFLALKSGLVHLDEFMLNQWSREIKTCFPMYGTHQNHFDHKIGKLIFTILLHVYFSDKGRFIKLKEYYYIKVIQHSWESFLLLHGKMCIAYIKSHRQTINYQSHIGWWFWCLAWMTTNNHQCRQHFNLPRVYKAMNCFQAFISSMVQDTILVSPLVWASPAICKTDKNIPSAPRGSCTRAILMHNCISKKKSNQNFMTLWWCASFLCKSWNWNSTYAPSDKKDKTVVNSNGQPLLFL